MEGETATNRGMCDRGSAGGLVEVVGGSNEAIDLGEGTRRRRNVFDLAERVHMDMGDSPGQVQMAAEGCSRDLGYDLLLATPFAHCQA